MARVVGGLRNEPQQQQWQQHQQQLQQQQQHLDTHAHTHIAFAVMIYCLALLTGRIIIFQSLVACHLSPLFCSRCM